MKKKALKAELSEVVAHAKELEHEWARCESIARQRLLENAALKAGLDEVVAGFEQQLASSNLSASLCLRWLREAMAEKQKSLRGTWAEQ